MGREPGESYYLLLKEKENEISRLEQEIITLKNQVVMDQMTGTLNRCEGLEKLRSEMRKNSRDNTNTTIAFIDIDGLKLINDKFGHRAGDQLLVEFSNILLANIRREDFVFRFGGDEFIIVFTGIAKIQAKKVWDRVYTEIEKFNKEGSFALPISLSVGFHENDSTSGLDINQFIHLADSKMYKEKQRKQRDYEGFYRSLIL